MTSLQRKFDYFYIIYFIIHIPITILVDSTIVIDKKYQLEFQKEIVSDYIRDHQDFLLIELPLWLKIFVLIELVYQLPFFFVNIWKTYTQDKKNYPQMLIYGINASLTTLVCLIYILVNENYEWEVRSNLIKFYLPTFMIPSLMVIDYLKRINSIIDEKVKSKEE